MKDNFDEVTYKKRCKFCNQLVEMIEIEKDNNAMAKYYRPMMHKLTIAETGKRVDCPGR